MTALDEFNDELFDEDLDSNSIEAEDENSEINEPFDPTKIRVNTRPMTIDLVLSRIKHGELELYPDFQRLPGIWTLVDQSRLIESMLLRIPLPAFYMDATDGDKWLVIDGLQRLTAINRFYNNELCLTGLEYITDLNGKKYEEIPRNYQRRILETQITVYEIERGTPPEVKFSIFKRINTGGLPLSRQEMRNALYQGNATQLLKKLADSEIFRQVTKITKRLQERMEDKEMGEISPGTRINIIPNSEMDLINLRYSYELSSPYRSTNVGFGVTYTLPILVAILAAEPGTLILLENPEAHLHPKGQSKIGELMALAASCGVQIIVETHSDHILNGIRVAVHQGKLNPDAVQLHHFQRQEKQGLVITEVISPKIDRRGRINKWPEGFFDEWDKSLEILLEPIKE